MVSTSLTSTLIVTCLAVNYAPGYKSGTEDNTSTIPEEVTIQTFLISFATIKFAFGASIIVPGLHDGMKKRTQIGDSAVIYCISECPTASTVSSLSYIK